jgi:hypothetical protein
VIDFSDAAMDAAKTAPWSKFSRPPAERSAPRRKSKMNIIRGKSRQPPRIVVYGPEGIGKSTFGANAPSPIFLQTEDGLGEIECDKFELARSYSTLLDQLGQLCSEEHDYKTVVLDTADWLEKLIWADVCMKEKKNNIEEIPFAKGYKFALTQWKEILSGLDHLRSERGMAVIVLAHAKIERFQDPESEGFDRYTLRLHKDSDAYLREWSDAVLFATRKQRVEKVGKGFNERQIAKPIGQDGGERILRTVGSPACVAKNRYGLPGEIPLSWQSFVECMN